MFLFAVPNSRGGWVTPWFPSFSWSSKLFLLSYFSAEYTFYMTGRTPQDVSHKTSKINWKARETLFRWDQLWDKLQHQLETTAAVQNVSIKNTMHFTRLSLLFINSPGEGINFSVAIISPRVNRLCEFKSHICPVFITVTCVCHEGI